MTNEQKHGWLLHERKKTLSVKDWLLHVKYTKESLEETKSQLLEPDMSHMKHIIISLKKNMNEEYLKHLTP
jgi:hypothetical protein